MTVYSIKKSISILSILLLLTNVNGGGGGLHNLREYHTIKTVIKILPHFFLSFKIIFKSIFRNDKTQAMSFPILYSLYFLFVFCCIYL